MRMALFLEIPEQNRANLKAGVRDPQLYAMLAAVLHLPEGAPDDRAASVELATPYHVQHHAEPLLHNKLTMGCVLLSVPNVSLQRIADLRQIICPNNWPTCPLVCHEHFHVALTGNEGEQRCWSASWVYDMGFRRNWR